MDHVVLEGVCAHMQQLEERRSRAEKGREEREEAAVSLSIGIEVQGGIMHKLIQRGTSLPCHRSEDFSSGSLGAPDVLVKVFEGERSLCRHNELLGQLLLRGVAPCDPAVKNLRVSLHVEESGDLEAIVTDLVSGNRSDFRARSDRRRTRKDIIDRVVKEAEHTREADEYKKRQIEARLQLEVFVHQLQEELQEALAEGRMGGSKGESGLAHVMLETLEWSRLNQNAHPREYVERKEHLLQASSRMLFKSRAGVTGPLGLSEEPEIID